MKHKKLTKALQRQLEQNSLTMGFHNLSSEEWDSLSPEGQAELHRQRKEGVETWADTFQGRDRWSHTDKPRVTAHRFVIHLTPRNKNFQPHIWKEGGKMTEAEARAQARQIRATRAYTRVKVQPA
jgi:hypothetical protein